MSSQAPHPPYTTPQDLIAAYRSYGSGVLASSETWAARYFRDVTKLLDDAESNPEPDDFLDVSIAVLDDRLAKLEAAFAGHSNGVNQRGDSLERRLAELESRVSSEPSSQPKSDDFQDRYTTPRDRYNREILTVAQLRELVNDPALDPETHVVLDDREGWYHNVGSVVIPATNPDARSFMCVTLFAGDAYDARQ